MVDYDFDYDDDPIHVVPVDDEKAHILSRDCPCEPELDVENGILVVIHRSYDHRELFEDLEEWWRNEFYE